MDINLSKNDNGVVVTVSGRLDLRVAEDLRTMMHTALEKSRGRLVVDLSKADFLDSAALGVLIGVQRAAHDRSGKLVLVSPEGPARHIFENTRTDQFLTLCQTVQQAQALAAS